MLLGNVFSNRQEIGGKGLIYGMGIQKTLMGVGCLAYDIPTDKKIPNCINHLNKTRTLVFQN